MKVILEQLWQLQELDRKMIILREGALAIPDLNGKQDELARLRLQEQEKKQGLDDLRLNRNQTKAALDSCRQRLLRAESAMKEVKGSEVLRATSEKIDQLKKTEEGLKLKERGIEKDNETLVSKIAELQHRRTVLEDEIESSSSVKRLNDHEIETAVREIEDLKSPIQCQIQPRYLSLYQRIAGSRGGIAVAQVRGGSCGGCNMVLPAQFVNELPRSNGIEQCPNCKRILVIFSGDSLARGSSR